jgi:ABC-type polysaccharide/polyol phosphate transport system ATPase subunit
MGTVKEIADEVIVLSKGEIRYSGSVEEGIEYYENSL